MCITYMEHYLKYTFLFYNQVSAYENVITSISDLSRCDGLLIYERNIVLINDVYIGGENKNNDTSDIITDTSLMC